MNEEQKEFKKKILKELNDRIDIKISDLYSDIILHQKDISDKSIKMNMLKSVKNELLK